MGQTCRGLPPKCKILISTRRLSSLLANWEYTDLCKDLVPPITIPYHPDSQLDPYLFPLQVQYLNDYSSSTPHRHNS